MGVRCDYCGSTDTNATTYGRDYICPLCASCESDLSRIVEPSPETRAILRHISFVGNEIIKAMKAK
jgi:hypothetical protein